MSKSNWRKKEILHGNDARMNPSQDIDSKFITQALSNIESYDKNAPLVSITDVIRERNWSIENKK